MHHVWLFVLRLFRSTSVNWCVWRIISINSKISSSSEKVKRPHFSLGKLMFSTWYCYYTNTSIKLCVTFTNDISTPINSNHKSAWFIQKFKSGGVLTITKGNRTFKGLTAASFQLLGVLLRLIKSVHPIPLHHRDVKYQTCIDLLSIT